MPSYGPNPGTSGTDPRGRAQNQSQYQQQRYEQQQGPMVSAFAKNYGRGAEANYGDYTDIMNNYRSIASGQSGGAEGGGGGGGIGYTGDMDYLKSPGTYNPYKVTYDDPYKSYSGYENFSTTGGYSPQDISNLRARGVSPIRAAYANAERGIGQQRSLQGGYSPNAIAARVKMAREQGQGMADAVQNVEAGIVDTRNKNQLAGLQGMYGVESDRLGAQLRSGEFNANQMSTAEANNIAQDWALQQANSQIQGRNLNARQSVVGANAGASSAAAAQNTADRLAALRGMTALYGTSPAMAEMFGNQLLQGVGQGGTFGLNLMGRDIESQNLPGKYDQTMGRTKDLINTGSTLAYPFLDYMRKKQQPQVAGGTGPGPWQGPVQQPEYNPYDVNY